MDALLGPRVDVPIHVAQIVARRIGAIFSKLLAESKIGRTMQSGHKSIHHRFGNQVEARNFGQQRGVDEAGWSAGVHLKAVSRFSFLVSRCRRCSLVAVVCSWLNDSVSLTVAVR
jgi:hypothetical protein